MPSSCKKVKNPCKICLGNVTHKSGIQCEGACKSWVHYKCLNFTPGKISDIKRGLIIVNCPCPDCKTNMPKELVKEEPFSCTNAYCPANMPPKCMNALCPSNAALPPPGHNGQLARPQQFCPIPQYGPCTVDNCKSTKVSPPQRQFRFSNNKNKSLSPCVSCCSGGDIKKAECVTQTKPQPPQLPCAPIPCLPPPPSLAPPPCPPPRSPPPPCPPPQCPPPPCPPRTMAPSPKYRCNSSDDAAIKNAATIKAMERMCTAMGLLTYQLNTLMDKMHLALTIPPPCPPPTCVMPSTQTNTDRTILLVNTNSSPTEFPCPGGHQGNFIYLLSACL